MFSIQAPAVFVPVRAVASTKKGRESKSPPRPPPPPRAQDQVIFPFPLELETNLQISPHATTERVIKNLGQFDFDADRLNFWAPPNLRSGWPPLEPGS